MGHSTLPLAHKADAVLPSFRRVRFLFVRTPARRRAEVYPCQKVRRAAAMEK